MNKCKICGKKMKEGGDIGPECIVKIKAIIMKNDASPESKPVKPNQEKKK